jgi:hypothetical protein
MNRSPKFVAFAVGALWMAVPILRAQNTTSSKPVTVTSNGSIDDDTATVRDTAALNALLRMGNYLRGLNNIQIKAYVTTEEVLTDDEKIQTSSVVNLIAHRPDKLRITIDNEKRPRTLYYDGSTFTVWAPAPKFYGQVAAPPSINELARVLEDKYDIDLPLVDMFRWGTPELSLDSLTSARDIGPAKINDITCEQYAFRQTGMDFQVWIQRGDYPLPLKVVLTTTDDDARPQHESVYQWNLAPSFNDAAFTFTPPKDAQKINLAEAAQSRLKKKETPR